MYTSTVYMRDSIRRLQLTTDLVLAVYCAPVSNAFVILCPRTCLTCALLYLIVFVVPLVVT